MTTALKGNTTEARVLGALVEQDLAVAIPFGEGHPYDLIVHLDGNLCLRIQCKTARENQGCAVCNARSTDHGRGRLSYLGQADLFGIHFPPTDSVFLVPVREFPHLFEVRLRVHPTRNNQQLGVRYASNYAVQRRTPERLRRLLDAEPDGQPLTLVKE